MEGFKFYLGAITILIGLVSYYFYFRDIFIGKTKPEAFSWLIWAVLASVTFAAQFLSGAGAGAWATAFTALMCLAISLTAFYRGSWRLKLVDVLSLAGAALGIVWWQHTANPFFAVMTAVVVGFMGFVPTFDKAFNKPQEETPLTFALNSLKFLVAFFALEVLSPVNWLYPAALALMNGFLAAMIFYRRAKLSKPQS